MLLSGRRLDHLSLLSSSDLNNQKIITTDNELIYYQKDIIPQNISFYQYVYLERYQHIDNDFIKAVVHEHTKITPDDIVPFNDKLAVLKNNQTIAVPEGVYRKLIAFNFSPYKNYFLISSNPLSVLACQEYYKENINIKVAAGKYFLVDDQNVSIHLKKMVQSLQEKGWEYVNYSFEHQGLYEEFTKEWDIQTKYVTFQNVKYYFVRVKEKFFLGTLERWISESLILLENNNLPSVYIFEYPHKGLSPASHKITVLYLAVRAYANLVENNTLLANAFGDIRVHNDLSIECKFFNAKEMYAFQKTLHNFDVLRERLHEYEVKSFYEGVLLRYVYQDSVLLTHNDKHYLVQETKFKNINLPVNSTPEIEKDLKEHLRQFYTFCQPKLPQNLNLTDLLSIVPEFTSMDPLEAICKIKNGTFTGVSEFIYQTLEYAWRGYYSYAQLKGLVPFIPYTPPESISYDVIEVGPLKLLSVNVQGIEVVISNATSKNIKKWQEEKYLVFWAKYYLRKYDQISKILLTLSAKTSLD